jgi:3-(3-hydroxy-phenyl)propionate hydroxylase
VDYQLPRGETPEEALRPESLKARIDAQLAMIGHAGCPGKMDWSSVYSARRAHGCPTTSTAACCSSATPRTCCRSSACAAPTPPSRTRSRWLAPGLRGARLGAATLLANYSRERVARGREIIDEAGKSTRFMTPPTPGFQLLRDAVLSLSLTQEFVRPLYHWRTSRPHEYADSALNCRDDDDALFPPARPTAPPPRNVQLGADDFLLDHLGGGLDLLYFTDASAIPAPLLAAGKAARARGLPLRITAVARRRGRRRRPDARRSRGTYAHRYGVTTPGAAYLLRRTSTSARAGCPRRRRGCKPPSPHFSPPRGQP